MLHWLLVVSGAAVVILLGWWSIRSQRKGDTRQRRRRSPIANEPKWSEAPIPPPEEPAEEAHNLKGYGWVTAHHHLADKVLVDVEIHPLPREGLDQAVGPSSPEAEPTQPLVEREIPKVEVDSGKPPTAPAATVDPALEAAQSTTREAKLESAVPPSSVTPPVSADSESLSDPLRQPMEPISSSSVFTPAVETIPEPAPGPEAKTTIALTVMALDRQRFNGADIQVAAEEAGLRLAVTGFFERHAVSETSTSNPVFSVAHLRKPGSFDANTLTDLHTPGLLMFMSLPGPLAGMKALDLLVLAADQVARKLNGVICDEQGQRMTNQGLLALRDQVARLESAAS